MPFSLFVVCAGEFLRAGVQGRPDLASSKRALADLIASMMGRGVDRALLDVREVSRTAFSTTEIFELAKTFHEVAYRETDRLAVLHRTDRLSQADFFAMCAVQRGWNVCAFDVFEEAFNWLSSSEEVHCPPMQPPAPPD